MAEKPSLLYINNRYRDYDRLKYETLVQAFKVNIIWINPVPTHEQIPAPLAQEIESHILGADQRKLRPWHLVRGLRLARWVKRLAPTVDLVVSSTSDSWKSKIVYWASRSTGTPVAFRKENWANRDKRLHGIRSWYWNIQQKLTQHIELNANAMLVGGVKAHEFLTREGVRNVYPFHYLHQDLALRKVDPELMNALKAQLGEGITFLYLGRIMPQKGLHVLIGAIKELLREGAQVNLLVVGGPITVDTGRGKKSVEYYESCLSLAKGEERILFIGNAQASQVHTYYHVADVFVHPHVQAVDGVEMHDGWGNVITEAASMSLPIISSDRVASSFDIIENDRNGFILNAAELESELVDAMRFFVENPDVIPAFKQHARQNYEDTISPARNQESLRMILKHGRDTSST